MDRTTEEALIIIEATYREGKIPKRLYEGVMRKYGMPIYIPDTNHGVRDNIKSQKNVKELEEDRNEL